MPQITEVEITQKLLKSMLGDPGASRTEKPSNGTFLLGLACVLIAAALLYGTFAISWLKFSRAEVFFAECAREMIGANNIITPLYHGKPFFDKPILVYWLIIGAFKSIGISHFAARIPSIMAALATVAITGYAGRALATSRKNAIGLMAAMICASSFMFLSFAYLCMSDMLLVLFDTATLMFLYQGANNERRRTLLWWLASVMMGLAFVTKGPVGIVLPAVAFLAYLGITKQLKLIQPLHVIAGAITMLVLALPWFYAAYQANGSWALAYFFIRENFQRYAGSTYDTHKPVWFMVTSMLTGFLPWSVFLPFAAMSTVKDCKKQFTALDTRKQLYLWTWIAVVVGFFSVSRGKIDYYVLPAYPAAAILVSLYISNASARLTPKVITTVLGVLAVAAAVLSPLLLTVMLPGQPLQAYLLTPAILTICGAAAVALSLRGRIIGAVVAVFCAVCFTGAGFASQVMPTLSRAQSIDFYADKFQGASAQTRFGVHRTLAHWVDELTFQSGREPLQLEDTAGLVKLFDGGTAFALVPETDYQTALASDPQLRAKNLRVIDRRAVSVKPLTPSSVYKRKGKVHDMTLLLLSN